MTLGSDKSINELAKQVKSLLQPSAESQDVGKAGPQTFKLRRAFV
jgi:hypothetical protein